MKKRLQYLTVILAGLGGLTLSQAASAQSPPLSAYSDYQLIFLIKFCVCASSMKRNLVIESKVQVR